MRLVVRLLGCEVLDIDLSDGTEDKPDLSLGGTTSSTGFAAPEPPVRPMGDDDCGD